MFNPLLKTKKSICGENCFASWIGTMASSRVPNSAVHRTPVKQRGSRVKPEMATVSLARGVFGGDRRARIETEREQSNAGEFPKKLKPCASVHQYHAYTWTYSNSLDLSLNSFSSRPFHASNSNRYRTHFFLSFLAVQRSNVWIFLFYLQFLLFTSKSGTSKAPLIIKKKPQHGKGWEIVYEC